MTIRKAPLAYVGAFVDELARVQVRHVVVSPGSRSTPLAMLLQEHPRIKVWMHVDERSAAFFALGMAKKSQETVALLCTSGTAAANYYPAVCEAFHARVPLLVLTADRPPELREIGAPQTMNQIDLYGKQVKWFMDMPLPEEKGNMLNYVRSVAGRAVSITTEAPEGPVHLNFPFRDPLMPDMPQSLVWRGEEEKEKPHVQVSSGRQRFSETFVQQFSLDLQQVDRGLLVCGPQEDVRLAQLIADLAQHLQFPILADPLSQIRSGSLDKTLVIDGYDAFLRSERFVETVQPELILRFGAMPVSKPFLLYLNKQSSVRQIIVESSTGWREPTSEATDILFTDPVQFCRDLLEHLQCHSTSNPQVESETIHTLAHPSDHGKASGIGMEGGRVTSQRTMIGSHSWTELWQQVNELSRQTIEENMSADMFEGKIMSELSSWMPTNATLFVGNSMPVRDLDTFFAANDREITMLGNRGVNGIDGLISTSLGAQAVSGEDEPVVLVLGDLSFYHDLNGLLAARQYDLNVTIIIVHNNGGGIFSFLTQSQIESESHFETLFGTPLNLDYEYVVRMYGGHFQRVKDWPSFRRAVQQGMEQQGLNVVEVRTDREQNVRQHQALFKEVSSSIRSFLDQWEG